MNIKNNAPRQQEPNSALPGTCILRALAVVALTLAATAAVPGCILRDFDYPEPSGIFVQGSCMCAICWTREFCWYPELGEGVEVTSGATCPSMELPDGTPAEPIRAVQASRLQDYFLPRDDAFFCVAPDGDNVNFEPDATCPAADEDRALVEHVDHCLDVPVYCRDPNDDAYYGCAERAPMPNLCPPGAMTGPRRTACGARMSGENMDPGLARARLKLLDSCAWTSGGDVDPPSDAPRRYCFLACDNPDTAIGITTPSTCDDVLFDPPEVTSAAFEWDLAGSGSWARLTAEADAVDIDISGWLALHAPGCGPLQDCVVELPYLHVTGLAPFTLAGETLDNVVVRNPEPIPGAGITAMTSSQSMFELASGAQVYVTGDVASVGARRANLFTSTGPIMGTMDWNKRIFNLFGTFSHSSGTTLELHIFGEFPNLQPRANAGPNIIAECQGQGAAVVTLNGVLSIDPDDNPNVGHSDIRSFHWSYVPSTNWPGNAPQYGEGGKVRFVVPLGYRSYTLTVSDHDGSMSSDTVAVTVQDTHAPIHNPSALPGACIPHDLQLRLFSVDDFVPAFQDACGANVTLQLVAISSNDADTYGPSPDLIGGAQNFCVRGQVEPPYSADRVYYVTLRASDTAGNHSDHTVKVWVPRGGSSCPYGSYWSVPTVSTGDPRCAE